MTTINGEKVFDPEEVERRSVIERPNSPNGNSPVPSLGMGMDPSTFFFIQSFADEILPWGWAAVKRRDAQLRNFIIQENIFASALGIVCSRNSGFSWVIDGPPRTAGIYQDVLEHANMGYGWHDLIVKTSIDLYTQDNGAFWELVRTRNSPDAPVIGINHLDAARCEHTGAVSAPVIYQDYKGERHLLQDYQVVEFAEMPTAIERAYGMQYCVLTRVLQKMQTTRNINIYDYEKTSGRNAKSIQLVKGITTQQLKDALAAARMVADNAGQIRYMEPVVVGTLDPTADIGHDTINLVEVPDGYNPNEAYVQYINLMAMGFATDYQEFAPLPGQRLGTGAQSEVLHLKARGKGPGTFMRMITTAINFRVMPGNCRFRYDEQDYEAEKSKAEVQALRAQTRQVRILSGEITPEVARQEAVDEGDMKYEYLQLMGDQDVTPDITVDSDGPAQKPQNIPPGTPAPTAAPSTQSRPAGPGRVPSANPPTPLGNRLRA